jgi:catechol 2,3-dioxygenase-like lactoylglutathione lyase family enzyme
MIEGLSHITFITRDLDRMETMLTRVLDARRIYDSGDKMFSLSKERFFDIGGVWIATMQGDPLLVKSYNHVAFKMADEEYEERLRRIRDLGLEVEEGRARVTGEGRSIYFYDDDNHLFELHSGTLAERLARYAKLPLNK